MNRSGPTGFWSLAVSLALACEPTGTVEVDSPPDVPSIVRRDVEPLRAFEAARRRASSFARLPASNGRFGADPYRVSRLPGAANKLLGVHTGRSEVVVLDSDLSARQRLVAPAAPRAVAIGTHGEIYVAGELEPRIQTYTFRDGRLAARFRVELPGVVGIRDLAVLSKDRLAVIEEAAGRLLEVRFKAPPASKAEPVGSVVATIRELSRSHGPLELRTAPGWLFCNSLLSHTIEAYPRDRTGSISGEPLVLQQDGPLWSFAVVSREKRTWVLAGGVENAPLDRTIGSFGNIDSYLYLYELKATGFEFQGSLNLSELGVVTPKVLLERPTIGERAELLQVTVAGYASEVLLDLDIELESPAQGSAAALELRHAGARRRIGLPGSAAGVFRGDGTLVLANPLFDLWAAVPPKAERADEVFAFAESENSDEDSEWRLGEALFFTELIAPNNRTEGALSRFSCETCHFEGFVDGRTHHTGRKQIRATTKPLLGLFNNAPHFSRALDKDLSRVAHAEFRVAGAGSETDPWFSVTQKDKPWLRILGARQPEYSPLALRRSLMAFLMRFSHRINPQRGQARAWSPEQRAGAELFRAACEDCHRAQLAADEPQTRVPFERWQEFTLAENAPLVWGSSEYRKTGVTPYVHPRGARVPSLRRLYKKWPYLTNGSAKSVAEVLELSRILESGFSHAGGDGRGLTLDEQLALSAFLNLL